MEATLMGFMEAYGREPWSPGGKVDCCLALAEWLIWLGYSDPAVTLRGTYTNEEGYRAIIAECGGVVPLIEAHLPPAAIAVSIPRCGDIGVVGSPANIQRQFGAIHDGSVWLVRGLVGFDRICARTLKSWRLPCHS